MNKEMVAKVKAYVDAHHDEIVKTYEEFINMPDFWRDKDNVIKVGQWLYDHFTEEGFKCEMIDVNDKVGKIVTGVLGEDRPGKPVMFSGHMDTALESNLYPDNPFHIKDGKAYGPGVLDMKGGIVLALYCCKALNAVGFNERPIKVLFAPDEEGVHTLSNVDEYIQAHSGGCLFALNMETGILNNGLCVGRKGRLGVDVFVEGKSAHAGADFTAGISSIEEMCKKVIDFQNLTDLDKDSTVNTGVIKGGTIPNAVPAQCMCSLDVRFKYMTELDRLRKAIKEICEKNYVKGTTCTFKETSLFTPFETHDDIMDVYHFFEKTAANYGMPETSPIQVGGCSDATYIQLAGTPVLCSCGPRGEWNHTTREYAVVDSMFERIYWYTAAIVDAGDFEK